MTDTTRHPRSRRSRRSRARARAADAPIPPVSIRLGPDGSAAVTTPRVLVWDEDARHALSWGSELAASAAGAAPARRPREPGEGEPPSE